MVGAAAHTQGPCSKDEPALLVLSCLLEVTTVSQVTSAGLWAGFSLRNPEAWLQ